MREQSSFFPRHRRPLLNSATYRSLVQILSHCLDPSLASLPPPPPHSKSGSEADTNLSSPPSDGGAAALEFGAGAREERYVGELEKDVRPGIPGMVDAAPSVSSLKADEEANPRSVGSQFNALETSYGGLGVPDSGAVVDGLQKDDGFGGAGLGSHCDEKSGSLEEPGQGGEGGSTARRCAAEEMLMVEDLDACLGEDELGIQELQNELAKCFDNRLPEVERTEGPVLLDAKCGATLRGGETGRRGAEESGEFEPERTHGERESGQIQLFESRGEELHLDCGKNLPTASLIENNALSHGSINLVEIAREGEKTTEMDADYGYRKQESVASQAEMTQPGTSLSHEKEIHLVGKIEHIVRHRENEECTPSTSPNNQFFARPNIFDAQKNMASPKGSIVCAEVVTATPDKRAHTKSEAVGPPAQISGLLEEPIGIIQQGNSLSSDTSLMYPGLRNLAEAQAVNPSNIVAEDEVEEGEIPNEWGGSDEEMGTGQTSVQMEVPVEMPSRNGDLKESITACSQSSSIFKRNFHVEHDLVGADDMRNVDNNLLDYGDLDVLKDLPTKGKCSETFKKGNFIKRTENKRQSEISIPDNLGLSAEVSEKFSLGEEHFNAKGVGVQEKKKKKKTTLTEERKAKKKLAKKRKRAETNKKLGIKRLKIQPVSLPKKVVYCSFYLKGRCQQGESCKFSHDTIPLTKSQPCKYFACNSCLKGDDCPFDHELWKYPCHNFVSKGTCTRGETCKFSHKIPITEDDSASTTFNKLISSTSSERLDAEKHSKLDASTSLVLPNNSLTNKTSAKPSSMSKHPLGLQVDKSHIKVPKGLCFLSFGKNLTEDTNNPQNKMSSAKGEAVDKNADLVHLQTSGEIRSRSIGACSSFLGVKPSQNAHVTVSGRDQSHSLSTHSIFNTITAGVQKSPVLNAPPNKSIEPITSNISCGPSSAPSGSRQSDVSEAARLLDEFLFSGT